MRHCKALVILSLTGLVVVALAGCCTRCEQEETALVPDFAALQGPYLGQEPPGVEPQLFAPGFVSTGLGELNSVFSPEGDEFYFAVGLRGRFVLLVTRQQAGSWTQPEVLPFSSEHSAVDLCLSADGQQMLFCSDRPRVGNGSAKNDFDLWSVERTDTGWGEPVNLGELVNSDGHEYYPTLTRDRTLYYQSGREGGHGGRDLYRARLVEGRYTEPENLGPVVNTPDNEGDVFVDPDESYIIFYSAGHEVTNGGGRLFISFRRDDDTWTEPLNLGRGMRADRSDFCPMLSPDGRYFFFSSSRPDVADESGQITFASLVRSLARPRNGNTDIYWVDAGFIDSLRASAGG